MSGFMFATSPCFGCGLPFAYNPDLVPSITIAGDRKPVCQVCVDRVNQTRVANGLPPIVTLPGAYDAQEV